ncbi:MAG: bifunctional UDP-3-O-[3-hydroxymyristoyl] N-acetylglucosamine deacetylase/3-hydroxyacyl-ACP dehydratase [Candidatus Aureabacteria bacterium]|nr:bifunctional UDP-3-O-[3-hydroxymyristoyl] N-acetylglucosamine deacetylase/3-hydroxyacyl-ACP dehydratase [Candidatus Auribacterota bacterium]
MKLRKQKTVKKEVSASGIGVHTGNKTTITFKPAPVNTGVRFVRTDVEGRPVIEADVDNVVSVARGTTIGKGNVKVHTVEHVLASLMAFGINNVIIEVDANEPPVGDGSSQMFVDLIKEAGTEEQETDLEEMTVREPVFESIDDAYVAIFPYDGFKVSYTISYDHPLVNTQYISMDIHKNNFEKEICKCRTFCFYRDVQELMDQGLIKGGSLDNAVVIGDEAILSKEELRYPNEFVRHKILDLMGDLYLIGKYIRGHFIASKSGHPLNVKFARKLKSRLVPINGDIENPGKKPKQTIEVAQEKMELDINDIMSILPHRYPFLLVDRIIKIDGKTKIVGMKNVTFNEQFFNGHFPGHPVMPGVLIVEAMAQVAGVLVLRMEENRNKMPYFMTIDKVRFRKPVFPGSTLIIDVEFVKVKTRTAKIKAKATVDGQIVTEAEMTFIVVNF